MATNYVRANGTVDCTLALGQWLIAMADNERGFCWVSQERLAALLNRKPETIGEALNRLVSQGYFFIRTVAANKPKEIWPVVSMWMAETNQHAILDLFAPASSNPGGRPRKPVTDNHPLLDRGVVSENYPPHDRGEVSENHPPLDRGCDKQPSPATAETIPRYDPKPSPAMPGVTLTERYLQTRRT